MILCSQQKTPIKEDSIDVSIRVMLALHKACIGLIVRCDISQTYAHVNSSRDCMIISLTEHMRAFLLGK